MKRCPECRRDYFDDTLRFCLDDGAELLEGPAQEDAATALLPGGITSETPTRFLQHSPNSRDDSPRPGSPSVRSAIFSDRRPLVIFAAVAILAVGGFLWYANSPFVRAKQIDSIAVMPFVNESGNPEMDYLSDGITESLINSLSKVPNIAVKARSSVFHYKGKQVSPQQLANELSVQAILTGRITQRGDRILSSLELIDAATGNNLWGEQYDRKQTDLTVLQTDIARDVSNELRSKLTGAEQQRVSKNYTENTEAYQLYLKGRFHWNKRSGADIRKSLDYFQKAIEKDPGYALAYAGLADAYLLLPGYANEPHQAAFPKARAAAAKALEIDDTLAEAHTALAAYTSDYEWNFPQAAAGFKRAIHLNPNYATAHHWYAESLAAQGRFAEALAEMKRAQEIDPLSLIINGLLGVMFRLNGEFDLALEQLHRTLEMDPNFHRTHIYLAETYEAKQMFIEAGDEFHRAFILAGLPAEEADRLRDASRQALRRDGPVGYYRKQAELIAERRNSKKGAVPPLTVEAKYLVLSGQHEEAIKLLEQGFKDHDPDMLRLRDPALQPLRSKPRYQELLRQMGISV